MFVCADCGKRFDRPGRCSADGRVLLKTDDPMLGSEVGRYRLARRIGKGGMGTVYLGVQPEIGSRVAIKVLSEACSTSPDLLERFFAEARAVNLIRHEGIVNVIDLDRLPTGQPYIVMEYIDGRTLRQVNEAGKVPLGGLVHVMTEVLVALEAAHNVGIVHRDIKPDNVLVTAAGRAKVLDFGIAKLASGHGKVTSIGHALGTPHYMAPEQIDGGTVDARTDVYATGVLLFELATGKKPFESISDYELMRAHLNLQPPSPRSLRREITAEFEAVILQALAKDPNDRFPTAKDMARALRQASTTLPPNQWRSLARGTWLPASPDVSGVFAAPPSDVTMNDLPQIPALDSPTLVDFPSSDDEPLTERVRGPKSPTPREPRASTPGEPTPREAKSPTPREAKSPTPRRSPPRPGGFAAPRFAAPPPVDPRRVKRVLIVAGLGAASIVAVIVVLATRPDPEPPAAALLFAGPVDAAAPPRVVGPGSAGPRVVGPGSAGPRVVGPGSAGPRVVDPEGSAGPRVVGPEDVGAAVPPRVVGPAGAPDDPHRELKRQASYPTTSFQPSTFLPTAIGFAAEIADGLELVDFTAQPVAADGGVDLTDAHSFVFYHLVPRARLQHTTESVPCDLEVRVTATQLTAKSIWSTGCDLQRVPIPHCNLRQIRQRAKPSVPAGAVVQIAWGAKEWAVSVVESTGHESKVIATQHLADACP